MRVPGRLHITQPNANTLKIDTDAGTQSREFHFGAPQPPSGEAGWQGYSAAQWERGGALVIFPEGTRHRKGPLARPKRGVGRLALETGAPVVPIAILGSERARRGWKIRPVWVRVRAGRPLTFPRVESPSPRLAEEVTARLWPCVDLQWQWLGGEPQAPVEHVQERKAA